MKMKKWKMENGVDQFSLKLNVASAEFMIMHVYILNTIYCKRLRRHHQNTEQQMNPLLVWALPSKYTWS